MLGKFHFNNMKKQSTLSTANIKCSTRGFTLLEMTVSLGLFTIIMFIATSAFLSIVNTDRKARATRIAIDNLNIALEDMTRKIKTGTTYYCGESATGTYDCPVGTPSNALSFNDQSGTRITYKLAQGGGNITAGTGCGFTNGVQGCILRTDPSSGLYMIATSPEIDITNLKFMVSGSLPCGGGANCVSSPGVTDTKQPTVVVLINGSLPAIGASATTTFKMQTTVTQRVYDH